jgi:hypothetical protein
MSTQRRYNMLARSLLPYAHVVCGSTSSSDFRQPQARLQNTHVRSGALQRCRRRFVSGPAMQSCNWHPVCAVMSLVSPHALYDSQQTDLRLL